MVPDRIHASTPFAWGFANVRDNVGGPLVGVSDFESFATAVRAGVEMSTVPDPPAWTEESINAAKVALPAFGAYALRGLRANENAIYITALVWDIDHATEVETAALFDRLRLRGLRGFAYESPSAGLKGNTPRYRLVLAVDRPVLPREWARLKPHVAGLLGIPFDPCAEKLSQIAFVGRFASTPARAWIEFGGAPINVDGEIALAPVILPQAPALRAIWGEEISRCDLVKLSQRLQRYADTTQGPTLGRMLEKGIRGERYALDGYRHTWNLRLGYVLGSTFPTGDPEQIAEFFRAALSNQGGKTVEEFAKLIESGQRRAATKDATINAILAAVNRRPGRPKLQLSWRDGGAQ